MGLVEREVGYSKACPTAVKVLDIDRVAEAIEKKGAAPFTLDTDKFPLEVQLTAQFNGKKSFYQLTYNHQSILSYLVRDRSYRF